MVICGSLNWLPNHLVFFGDNRIYPGVPSFVNEGDDESLNHPNWVYEESGPISLTPWMQRNETYVGFFDSYFLSVYQDL